VWRFLNTHFPEQYRELTTIAPLMGKLTRNMFRSQVGLAVS
jgi:hypothetical protein